jgi:hypothetical protein
MSWFQLDPQSIASRAQGSTVPSLSASLWRGIIGFTLVSIAGFVPWGVFGTSIKAHIGELGMYLVCALVFLVLSGLLLHKLIIGEGSLSRFYKLFTPAFAAYSVAWIVGWMSLRGHPGSIVGLFAGTALMGWMLAFAFDAHAQSLKIIAALFILNSIGYFVGGVIELALIDLPELTIGGVTLSKPTQVMMAKMQWGVCYGIGLGAGLGLAFHLCQAHARVFIAAES